MILEVLKEAVELAMVVALIFYGATLVARRGSEGWRDSFQRHRWALLVALTLASTAIMVGEEVLEGETNKIDEAILWFIHQYVTPGTQQFFEVVTLTGSGKFLWPLVLVTMLVLARRKQVYEALVLGASGLAGAMTMFALKTAVGRPRPALWETDWYWGSSFPSGHTLSTSVVATALLLNTRLWPWRAKILAASLAILWVALVALSRLVLGVHWPTDVVTAACLGVVIAQAVRWGFSYLRKRRERRQVRDA